MACNVACCCHKLRWINNYIHYKIQDEITYPFPNFNGCTVEVWEWLSNFNHTALRGKITYPWNCFSGLSILGANRENHTTYIRHHGNSDGRFKRSILLWKRLSLFRWWWYATTYQDVLKPIEISRSSWQELFTTGHTRGCRVDILRC